MGCEFDYSNDKTYMETLYEKLVSEYPTFEEKLLQLEPVKKPEKYILHAWNGSAANVKETIDRAVNQMRVPFFDVEI